MLKNNKGTSLIEATIVILVISIISVMVFSMLNTAISVHARARENFRVTSEVYSGIESGIASEKIESGTISIIISDIDGKKLPPITSSGSYAYGNSEDGIVSMFEFVVGS